MLLYNTFHSDDNSHDHVPFITQGFPYVCIKTDMDKYTGRCVTWHWNSSCEIVTVEKGEVELKTPDTTVLLHRGDAVFVNKGIWHFFVLNILSIIDSPM